MKNNTSYKIFKNVFKGIGIGEYLGTGENFGIGAALIVLCYLVNAFSYIIVLYGKCFQLYYCAIRLMPSAILLYYAVNAFSYIIVLFG